MIKQDFLNQKTFPIENVSQLINLYWIQVNKNYNPYLNCLKTDWKDIEIFKRVTNKKKKNTFENLNISAIDDGNLLEWLITLWTTKYLKFLQLNKLHTGTLSSFIKWSNENSFAIRLIFIVKRKQKGECLAISIMFYEKKSQDTKNKQNYMSAVDYKYPLFCLIDTLAVEIFLLIEILRKKPLSYNKKNTWYNKNLLIIHEK